MPSPAPTSDVKLNTVSVEPMVTVAASSRKPSVARASPSCGNSVTCPVRVTSRPVTAEEATIESVIGSKSRPD